MASSSSTVSVFDAHRFHKAHNEQLFESYARRRKVIPELSFNLNEDEYPQIMEQIALRGWRRTRGGGRSGDQPAAAPEANPQDPEGLYRLNDEWHIAGAWLVILL
ncbi:hypothetical protein PIB30_089829 [Stylosanthes scabra]|uniref:Uncharacterized protein n=1 Tax=Stylosanthes scabra TaxID=79078 RepID=A0ABU6UXS2_9FABA|nr:hypothetical protein [Stylosanthes scabra]